MAILDKATLKAKIADYIVINSEGLITEVKVKELLDDMVDSYLDPSTPVGDATTLNGLSANQIRDNAVNIIRAAVTGTYDTLEKVENALIDIYEQLSTLNIADIIGLQATIDTLATKVYVDGLLKKIAFVGGLFDASISQILYVGSDIEISWDATAKQPVYAVTDWGDHAGGMIKADGSSTFWRSSTGTKGAADGGYFFEGSGSKSVQFDHENFGAYSKSWVIKHINDPDHRCYILDVVTGDVSRGAAFKLTIINR